MSEKHRQVNVRFTQAEYDKLELAAGIEGQSPSQFVKTETLKAADVVFTREGAREKLQFRLGELDREKERIQQVLDQTPRAPINP